MSSNYSNYRISIGGVTLNDTMVSKGTYRLEKAEREINAWRDANGTDHIDNYNDMKTVITFSLRERSLAEQEAIITMFSSLENLSVTYWDDFVANYSTGTFFMHPPEFRHRNIEKDSILYDTTEIVLEEY